MGRRGAVTVARTGLVACSAAQMVASTIALRYAVEQGLAVDLPYAGIRRRGDDVPRDSWYLGTGVSQPLLLMAVQLSATSCLLRRQSTAAALALTGIGAVMLNGYVTGGPSRRALTAQGWSREVTPLTGAGLVLSAGMTAFGISALRRSR
jgi:hypothetical protein